MALRAKRRDTISKQWHVIWEKAEISSEAAMKVERTILLGAQNWGQFEKFWFRKHPTGQNTSVNLVCANL